MMFTPLIFISNLYALTLVFISVLLLIKWEIVYKRHPERYTENTNESLACKNCREKLCQHKKQLQSFLKKQREEIKRKTEKLKEKAENLKNKITKK